MNDIKDASFIDIIFEFGEEDLFQRMSENNWHREHWDKKGNWEFKEDNIEDSYIISLIDNFPEAVVCIR